MVAKKTGKKKGKKGRVKALNLKRQTIKDLSGKDKKKVRGGGALASSVIQSRVV